MQLGSKYKALIAMVLIVALSTLMALHTIDPVVGMGPITLITGIVIGNGNSSRQGQGISSIIESKTSVPVSTDAAP